jgi:XisH protein
MPARDTYHEAVRDALIADGWTITHDPYRITYGVRNVYVDLGAERTLGAERGDERIAVEIKCFLGASDLKDLYDAVGQFFSYRTWLAAKDPGRGLVLAVPFSTYESTFSEPMAREVLAALEAPLLIFDQSARRIIQWLT